MAESLQAASPETLAAFDTARPAVEDDVARRCLAEDDPTAAMGPDAETKIRAGLGFVSKMLRATLAFGAEGILNDEMDWGKTRLPEYGVSAVMVLRNFERYTTALEQRLPAAALNEVRPYLDHMVAMQRAIAGSRK